MPERAQEAESPTWENWAQIPAVCLYPRNLASNLAVAAIVGTLLFSINQLDIVLRDGFGPRVFLKAGLTYLVPFLVANYGLLVGTRKRTA
jgi:hypothetical protein